MLDRLHDALLTELAGTIEIKICLYISLKRNNIGVDNDDKQGVPINPVTDAKIGFKTENIENTVNHWQIFYGVLN